MSKQRLDLLLAELYPDYSRRQLQDWISQGRVTVKGVVATKVGQRYDADAEIVVDIQTPKYVSRAGYKLEKALDHFGINVEGLVAMDAGLSTGGFADCLLQRGAAKIYGIDVGHSQVHPKIQGDERVSVMEQTNLRTVRDLGQKVDLVTLDLSFISLLKVMDAVCAVLKSDGILISLIKPQFEVERHQIGKGGIVKDPAVHVKVQDKIVDGIQRRGFECIGTIESPIEGGSGNKEFLGYFKRIN